MSGNYNKTAMCNICGKVMRDDNLKRHIRSRNGEINGIISSIDNQCGQLKQNGEDFVNDGEGFKVEVADELLETCDVNLKLELHRDNEVYQKNVEIGRQISILLKSDNIPEKSLSRQNKFCLDLFRAQQPTTDVNTAEPRLWQKQLLDIVSADEMDDRKIIWVVGKNVTKASLGFSLTYKVFTENIVLLALTLPTRQPIFCTL